MAYSLPTVNFKFVVAIDFGTCLSGYAFSSTTAYKTNPLDIKHYQCRNSTQHHRNILKTATCVLFDAEKKFIAFGYDAQDKYAELQNDGKHGDHLYFQHFKMKLYDTKESLKELMVMDIQDNNAKQMSALDIFSASIQAIKEDVISRIAKAGFDEPENNIKWVLTVPAIWHESSKSFMRESAKLAGIPSNQLLIALEPEAASIYCQYLVRENPNSIDPTVTHEGTKYVVVDIGGGTTDITVHQKLSNSHLKELRKPEGLNVASTSVDEAIMKLFENIFGHAFLKCLRIEYPDLYLELYGKIEDLKKSLPDTDSENISISLPVTSFNEVLKKNGNINVDHAVLEYLEKYNGDDKVRLELKREQMFMKTKDLIKLFSPTIGKIVNKVKAVLSFDTDNHVSLIILVGGFAECNLLRNAMENTFPPKKVIVPFDASLAVLKGAVLFGQDPGIINPRITRFNYGLKVKRGFDPEKHKISKKFVDDWGGIRCDDIFDVIINQNESVDYDKVIERSYFTAEKQQRYLHLIFYSSDKKNPLYTDEDGSKCIGRFKFDIKYPSDDSIEMKVRFMFGQTELKAEVVDGKHGILQTENLRLTL